MSTKSFYGVLFSNKQRFTLMATTPQEAIQLASKQLGYKVDNIVATKQGFNVVVYLLNGERKSVSSYAVKASKIQKEENGNKQTPFRKQQVTTIPTFVKKTDAESESTLKGVNLSKKSNSDRFVQHIEIKINAGVEGKDVVSMDVSAEDIKKSIEKGFEGECVILKYTKPFTEPYWCLECNVSFSVSLVEGYDATMWDPGEPTYLEGYLEDIDIRDILDTELGALGLPIENEYTDVDIRTESEEFLLKDYMEEVNRQELEAENYYRSMGWIE